MSRGPDGLNKHLRWLPAVVPGLVRGLEPTRFNTFLSQGHPIAPGCFAVFLRVLAIQSRGSTLRPVVAVFTIGRQKLGKVEGVVMPVGREVAFVGEGIPLVGGGQDLLDGPPALGQRHLPGLQAAVRSRSLVHRLPDRGGTVSGTGTTTVLLEPFFRIGTTLSSRGAHLPASASSDSDLRTECGPQPDHLRSFTVTRSPGQHRKVTDL